MSTTLQGATSAPKVHTNPVESVDEASPDAAATTEEPRTVENEAEAESTTSTATVATAAEERERGRHETGYVQMRAAIDNQLDGRTTSDDGDAEWAPNPTRRDFSVTNSFLPLVQNGDVPDAPDAATDTVLPYVVNDTSATLATGEPTDAADASRANDVYLPLVQRGAPPNDGFIFGGDGAMHPPGTDPATIGPIEPTPGTAAPTNDRAYWVNGIQRSEASTAAAAQALADETGDEIIGINNATEGLLADVAQSAQDQAHSGNNPATATVVSLMQDAIDNGQDIKLYAESQGGAILDHAAEIVHNEYYLEALANGLSDADARAEANQKMEHVNVVTYGSYGSDFNMPVGNVRHYVNTNDPVPTQFGVDRLGNPPPDANATVLRKAWGPAGVGIFDPRIGEVHLAENYFANTDPSDVP